MSASRPSAIGVSGSEIPRGRGDALPQLRGVRTSTVAPQLRIHGVISRSPPTSNVRSTVPSAFSSSR